MTGFESVVRAELDRWSAAGKVARFWLRDDDATEPTPALERLLSLTESHAVPLALAVIPEPTDMVLARRLAGFPHVVVTVHGWSHVNHAADGCKKQELGADRPAGIVLGELAAGFAKLRDLHGAQFLPVLVPPWNRIATDLLPHLASLGFEALSVYGREKPGSLPCINAHVDVMDWHGTRGCRDWSDLARDIVERLRLCFDEGGSLGLLTHHLVHDARVWAFLERLFSATASHPACRWLPLGDLMPTDR